MKLRLLYYFFFVLISSTSCYAQDDKLSDEYYGDSLLHSKYLFIGKCIYSGYSGMNWPPDASLQHFEEVIWLSMKNGETEKICEFAEKYAQSIKPDIYYEHKLVLTKCFEMADSIYGLHYGDKILGQSGVGNNVTEFYVMPISYLNIKLEYDFVNQPGEITLYNQYGKVLFKSAFHKTSKMMGVLLQLQHITKLKVKIKTQTPSSMWRYSITKDKNPYVID